MQNRFKSKVVWLAITSTLLTLFGHLGLYETLGITPEWAQGVVDSVLAILVAFGVLNNPTDKESF
jgi:uncharacterized membrane protein